MTGSHGFVGSNLIESLSDEYEIIRWDINSDDPIPDVDAVIHLAGLAHDTNSVVNEEEYFRVNTELTKKIYTAFLNSTAKKFIFFSSIKAKDNDTPYARSKKAAEDYINGVRCERQKDKDDKITVILRPCMIHGPGNKGNLNLLYKVVRLGIPWPLAAFENKRSFVSIGNICYIVNLLLQNEVKSGVYNVCDDEPISTNELIDIICLCLGRKARLWRIPCIVMTTCAKLGDCLHLPLNSERLEKLTTNYVIDNSLIKQALGIDKMPIEAKDGFKISIKSMIDSKSI